MTSLNTTTGWDANKQTGSNLTHSNIQLTRFYVALRFLRRKSANQYAARKGSSEGSGRDGSGSHISSHVTPSSSSSSTSSTVSSTVTPALKETTTSELDVMRQREVFFREKYDPMTGVRIASTLGFFFLFVLLTLLYKSKCKHKHSREPSTLTLQNMTYPAVHPQHLMRGQNVQVNGRHDFGGSGGGSDGGSPGHPMSLTLLDSTCYSYMNQVHPTNSHQPMFSNCYGDERHVKNPAVLLTAANSESSDEDLSLISGNGHHGSEGPQVPPERKRTRNPLGPLPPYIQVKAEQTGHTHSSHHHLHPRSKSPPLGSRIGNGGKGNIDINVILPTPSISPSGSENFNVASGHYYGGGHQNPMALLPRMRCGSGGGGRSGERRYLVSRSLSSDNENDNSEMSGNGASDSEAPMFPFGCGNTSLFSLENLKYVDDTSSENIPTRASDGDDQDQDQDTRSIGSDSVFACFEHNFDHIAPTYARRVSSISGTSSGVLVAHTQPSTPAPPPPPLPPQSTSLHTTAEIFKVTGGYCGSSGYGEGEETEFRVTLTQAHALVHHRDSFCSDLESINDYMETGARRRSSSTQTTLSDLRQALGYSPVGWSGFGESCGGGGGGGTGMSPGTPSIASYPQSQHETPPNLSVPRRRRSLSPHMHINNSPSVGVNTTSAHLLSPSTSVVTTSNSTSTFLSVTLHPPPSPLAGGAASEDGITPTTPTNPSNMMLSQTIAMLPSTPVAIAPARLMRKRSFEAVRKTMSLQCEERAEASNLFVSSSNETTPTN